MNKFGIVKGQKQNYFVIALGLVLVVIVLTIAFMAISEQQTTRGIRFFFRSSRISRASWAVVWITTRVGVSCSEELLMGGNLVTGCLKSLATLMLKITIKINKRSKRKVLINFLFLIIFVRFMIDSHLAGD